MNSVESQSVESKAQVDVSSLQVLCAVLTLATVGWMVYVIFGTDALGDQQQPVMGTWTIFGAGFAGIAILLRMFISNMMELAAVSKPEEGEEDLPADREKLIHAYKRQFVVSLFLLVSAACLNIDATFYEHNWASLGVASIVIIGMVALFPTSEGVEKWIAKRMSRDT